MSVFLGVAGVLALLAVLGCVGAAIVIDIKGGD
jgi:hypothetical protein